MKSGDFTRLRRKDSDSPYPDSSPLRATIPKLSGHCGLETSLVSPGKKPPFPPPGPAVCFWTLPVSSLKCEMLDSGGSVSFSASVQEVSEVLL